MPGPANTLLIEGSFSELSEELASYLDAISKAEEGSGLHSEIEPNLNILREAEQSQDQVDPSSIDKQKDDVLKKIVTKASVLNSAPEKEFIAAYNLLINLTSQSSIRDQLLARICQYLSEQPVTSSTQYGSALAITTLSTIFNILPPSSDARYHVFLAILKVIRTTSSRSSFDALVPQLSTNIPIWLSAWQLDSDDARNLYTTIADVAESLNHHDFSYTYLLKALETISPKSASSSDAASLSKRVLITALTNSTVYDFTPLTASDAIQSLRKSDSNLFELLEIFSSDDYGSYTDFLETNSLSSFSIPDDAAPVMASKMRLLTLATIAASSSTRSVPYSTIASALQIPSEDVEMWVIDTIRAGLVEGKLSQLKQEFLVQRATYRVFGEKQWAEIQGRLMVWRRSLESVLQVVRNERERFAREGPGGGHEDGQQGGRVNGFADGQGGRRGGYGGRRGQQDRHQQPREVDFAATE